MALAYVYPATRYQPSPPVDLSQKEQRARISPPAIRAFLRLIDRWNVRDEDARTLLGGLSNGAFYAMKKQPERTLDPDRLLRISYLLGIFESLNVLYSPALADAWIQRPNSNRIFAGRTPLAYMLSGGLPAMQTVRRLLDARRNGV